MVDGIGKFLLFLRFILLIFEVETFYLNSVWRENGALNDYISHFGETILENGIEAELQRKLKTCFLPYVTKV